MLIADTEREKPGTFIKNIEGNQGERNKDQQERIHSGKQNQPPNM